MHTIMVNLTNGRWRQRVYEGPWGPLQLGERLSVDGELYLVAEVAITTNRVGGRTQEVVVAQP